MFDLFDSAGRGINVQLFLLSLGGDQFHFIHEPTIFRVQFDFLDAGVGNSAGTMRVASCMSRAGVGGSSPKLIPNIPIPKKIKIVAKTTASRAVLISIASFLMRRQAFASRAMQSYAAACAERLGSYDLRANTALASHP